MYSSTFDFQLRSKKHSIPQSRNIAGLKAKMLSLLPFIIVIPSAWGVMVIDVGNGHGDTSSNPGRDWLHFI